MMIYDEHCLIKLLCAAVLYDDLQRKIIYYSFFLLLFHMMIYDEPYLLKLLCAAVPIIQ